MSRKALKRVLFIPGAVIGAVGFGMVMYNIMMMAFYNMNTLSMAIWSVIAYIGYVPMCISMLMHSKDIRETKQGVSIALKVLAYFWLIGGAVNAVGMMLTSFLG